MFIPPEIHAFRCSLTVGSGNENAIHFLHRENILIRPTKNWGC